MVFVITGFLQATLLSLAIYYYFVGKREMTDEVQAEIDGRGEGGDERSGLLANGNARMKSGPEYGGIRRDDAGSSERDTGTR